MALKKIIRSAIIYPIKEFIGDSRAVGITLLACTCISLLITNFSNGAIYSSFWNTSFHFPEWIHLPHTIIHWINDVLMVFFFFLVGMEIKRELILGELSSFRKAILPLAAALGGMLVPAGIYWLFNNGTEYAHGWGIPMATDIAFSLGVASLLGARVPASLKIFLMALAIIDDLGAIIVIALFYGEEVSWAYLAVALSICLLAWWLNYKRLINGWMLVLIGLLLWYCIFNSGIHATIAGVLLALFVPLNKLEVYEHMFHDAVSFLVLPVFALANTAIMIPGDLIASLTSSLSWGVMIGLMVGKPLGITLFCALVIALNWGERPSGSTWLQLLGIGILAGIGFTMSIFITMLAFNNPAWQDVAKIAVMLASLLSVAAGLIVLYLAGGRKKSNDLLIQ